MPVPPLQVCGICESLHPFPPAPPSAVLPENKAVEPFSDRPGPPLAPTYRLP